MAYRIDFTASNYTLRSRRKAVLRALLVATVAALAWEVHDCYVTYNQPTLNMRLADYEAVARPIEEMSAAWDTAEKEYNSMVRYYRLLWAANATNFLSSMTSENAPRPGRGFSPSSWVVTTGGDCALTYAYKFGLGDKAEQSNGLEDRLVNMVTSAVKVVGGRVDVQGVQHENLLNVDGFNVAVKFGLQNARTFPAKEASLAACVKEICEMRKRVQELKLENSSESKGVSKEIRVDEIMRQYLPMGKDKPGFPAMANVIDVAGWFNQADAFIVKNRIPVDDKTRERLQGVWNRIGKARFPWERYRPLDNKQLVFSTKELGTVSDGVKRFKGFLDKRHLDCLKKLEPFVEAYSHNDVFNNPFVETDLKYRVAKAAGVFRAAVSFRDEPSAEPAVLEKQDDRFVFSWVRWTLSLGGGVDRDGARERQDVKSDADPITLAMVADCARRAMTLGPGYALEKVRIDFDDDGNVAGAALDGLLPVKKVESVKRESGNVH